MLSDDMLPILTPLHDPRASHSTVGLRHLPARAFDVEQKVRPAALLLRLEDSHLGDVFVSPKLPFMLHQKISCPPSNRRSKQRFARIGIHAKLVSWPALHILFRWTQSSERAFDVLIRLLVDNHRNEEVFDVLQTPGI
jgi:hypothetical protein